MNSPITDSKSNEQQDGNNQNSSIAIGLSMNFSSLKVRSIGLPSKLTKMIIAILFVVSLFTALSVPVEAFATSTKTNLAILRSHDVSDSASRNCNFLRRKKGTQLHGLVEAWDAYNQALAANPLPVKSVTACGILGCADFAGQLFEKSKGSSKNIDLVRTLRFAIFGLVLQAPWNHFYYQVLDAQIPPTEDPFSQTNLLKVAIDQFIQAPIFTVLIFVFLGALEGKAISDIQKQLKEDYPSTIVANCKEMHWMSLHFSVIVSSF
jgi:hypothetical protein